MKTVALKKKSVAAPDIYLARKEKVPTRLKTHDPEGALDEALKESFPASDPVSIDIAKPVKE
jgi:hypothetical protein